MEAALSDYGVVLTGSLEADDLGYDAEATSSVRADRSGGAGGPFFDRGPGYARLSGGAEHADVDVV